MKVIITGGTGLIGRALTAKLLAKHHDVYVLSRTPDKFRSRALNGVQLIQWDGKTADGWGKLVDGNTAIINLAGTSIAGDRPFPPQKWTPDRKASIRDSRAEAGSAIVDAVKQADVKPKFVLQSSAVGYYGTKTGDEKLTENAPAGEDFLAMVCVPWERSTQAVEAMGVRRAVIRTGLVMSMKGGALPQMVMPFKFFSGGPIGSGWQWMSWIHIADQVGAMVYLLENENLSGTFNLTAPEPVRNEALARAIGKAMKRPAFFQTPATVFKLGFGELSTVLLDGQRVIPQALLDSGYQFQFTDVQTALNDLMKQE